MQTASRPFYSKTPVADDNEPIYLRPAKSHLVVRLLIFLGAFAAAWSIAWITHQLILWIRHPEVAPDGVATLGEGVYYVFQVIRHALDH